MEKTREEYQTMVQRHRMPSPVGQNTFRAFWTGGSICTFGQLLRHLYGELGLDREQSALAVSVTLIGLAVLLTALGVFDRAAKYAGAGTLVPITGFANAMAAPALEFRTEGILTGTAAKMFLIAGPVLVAGTVAGAVYGFIYWFLTR